VRAAIRAAGLQHFAQGADHSGMSTAVTAEPVVMAWHPLRGMLRATCRLRYEPSDPYAVTVGASRADGRPTSWTFARSLLADGAAGRAGIGDVRIWRVTTNDSLVAMALSGQSGTTHLYAPVRAVEAFLDATYLAVPAGTEHLALDVDRQLEELLGQADD
jgi:hypothetical protein